MNKFVKRPVQGASPLSPRAMLENKYKVARINLLVAIIFTIVNIITVTGGTYMLFSVYLPYLLAVIGASWCGMMPAEWYEGVTDPEFMDPSFFVVMVVIAAVILSLYALCFFMSKKHKSGWFVFALVMFCIDTVIVILDAGIANSIIDLVFHGFVIYYLIMGIQVPNKLKALDEQEAAAAAAEAAKAAEAATQEAADKAEEPAEELPDAWVELNARADNSENNE